MSIFFISVWHQRTKHWLFFHSTFSCNSILKIDGRWMKASYMLHQTMAAHRSFIFSHFSFSSLNFPIGSWLNEQEEMLHVALFRRLLFLSIWSSLLVQQAGHSIRCFEPAWSIVSLHFLLCLPVFPKALVPLISRGPSALQTFIFSRIRSSHSSQERPKDGWCLENREFGGHWLEWWKTKWLPVQDLNTVWRIPSALRAW